MSYLLWQKKCLCRCVHHTYPSGQAQFPTENHTWGISTVPAVTVKTQRPVKTASQPIQPGRSCKKVREQRVSKNVRHSTESIQMVCTLFQPTELLFSESLPDRQVWKPVRGQTFSAFAALLHGSLHHLSGSRFLSIHPLPTESIGPALTKGKSCYKRIRL